MRLILSRCSPCRRCAHPGRISRPIRQKGFPGCGRPEPGLTSSLGRAFPARNESRSTSVNGPSPPCFGRASSLLGPQWGRRLPPSKGQFGPAPARHPQVPAPRAGAGPNDQGMIPNRRSAPAKSCGPFGQDHAQTKTGPHRGQFLQNFRITAAPRIGPGKPPGSTLCRSTAAPSPAAAVQGTSKCAGLPLHTPTGWMRRTGFQ